MFFRYDHLAKVLTKVLEERPENVADVFEDFSNNEKRAKFVSNVDTVQNKHDKSTEVALAEIQEKLFSVSVTYVACVVA
jgi:radial spoke head protein 4A